MATEIPFWTANGFEADPFEYTNADQEELLQEYFIEPPFFQSVIGHPKSPAPAGVFAPRGAGKSALRRVAELQVSKTALTIRYTSFPLPAGVQVKTVEIDYHLSNLIPAILIELLALIAQGPFKMPDNPSRKTLSRLSGAYLADIDVARLSSSMDALQSLPEKAKALLKAWSGGVGTFSGYLVAAANGASSYPGPLILESDERAFERNALQDFKALAGC